MPAAELKEGLRPAVAWGMLAFASLGTHTPAIAATALVKQGSVLASVPVDRLQ